MFAWWDFMWIMLSIEAIRTFFKSFTISQYRRKKEGHLCT